uniref:Uncharacterized protein n=1 Tax=Arundo donax TaxID=35708 RepID=A0A0A9HWA5_ARUDO
MAWLRLKLLQQGQWQLVSARLRRATYREGGRGMRHAQGSPASRRAGVAVG